LRLAPHGTNDEGEAEENPGPYGVVSGEFECAPVILLSLGESSGPPGSVSSRFSEAENPGLICPLAGLVEMVSELGNALLELVWPAVLQGVRHTEVKPLAPGGRYGLEQRLSHHLMGKPVTQLTTAGRDQQVRSLRFLDRVQHGVLLHLRELSEEIE
jgi:hypothetical protein